MLHSISEVSYFCFVTIIVCFKSLQGMYRWEEFCLFSKKIAKKYPWKVAKPVTSSILGSFRVSNTPYRYVVLSWWLWRRPWAIWFKSSFPDLSSGDIWAVSRLRVRRRVGIRSHSSTYLCIPIPIPKGVQKSPDRMTSQTHTQNATKNTIWFPKGLSTSCRPAANL